MTSKTGKLADVSSLLGVMSAKQASGEIKKSPIQTVLPIESTEFKKHSLELKNKNSKTLKQENNKDQHTGGKAVGRPSVKKIDVEYVKISPCIPKDLKKKIGLALLEDRFTDSDGTGIKTLDELVSLALERLLSPS
jgi:hypothetical protein